MRGGGVHREGEGGRSEEKGGENNGVKCNNITYERGFIEMEGGMFLCIIYWLIYYSRLLSKFIKVFSHEFLCLFVHIFMYIIICIMLNISVLIILFI